MLKKTEELKLSKHATKLQSINQSTLCQLLCMCLRAEWLLRFNLQP
jgi:hypothetical protein